MSIFNKYNFFFLCLLLTGSGATFEVSGQAARTPYSSFGIGEPYGNVLVNHQGMAGVGVSQPQFLYINNQNPALLVYNSIYTGFQAGIIMERRNISGDTLSETTQGGNMNYLVTAFPVKPSKWTTSVGLMPYSSVNYNLQYTDGITGSSERVRVNEEGSGGLTQLYWSNGVRITKEIAVGVKAAYIFSSIVNSSANQLINSNEPVNYITSIEEKAYVRDFAFGTGLSFSKDSLFSGGRYRLSFGAVYNLATDLDATKNDKIYRTTGRGDSLDITVLNKSNGSFSIPASFTVGLSLSRGFNWNIGTEFSYQDWSVFKNVNGENQGLGESWRAALGGEVIPDQFATENYLKRMTYRAGVSMEQYPFLANGNTVKDIGINFGLSLPAGRFNSVDLAFKYGRRGDKAENLLEEDYFKIYFGITFNDQWFIKRKFN